MLCSVVGAERPERHEGGVREFLAAKQHAERRLARLELPWTVLRFGRLTEAAGTGRIATGGRAGVPLILNRDDAALTVVEALTRSHLARQAVPVLDGERHVAEALDAIVPRPLPAPSTASDPLGAVQSENPPDDPDMIAAGAPALDADVEWEGDGPVPAQPTGNDDPAPGIP